MSFGEDHTVVDGRLPQGSNVNVDGFENLSSDDEEDVSHRRSNRRNAKRRLLNVSAFQISLQRKHKHRSSKFFRKIAKRNICHAKSQFGLATQMGVCACYTTRSLTGGIGGF